MGDLCCNICFISSREFIFGSVQAKKGDFVLVSNADAVDPDTPEGCDVAEIIELYETGKVNFAIRNVDCFLAYSQLLCYLRFASLWLLFGVSGNIVQLLDSGWPCQNCAISRYFLSSCKLDILGFMYLYNSGNIMCQFY
jgi:hypothetical protein